MITIRHTALMLSLAATLALPSLAGAQDAAPETSARSGHAAR